MLCRQKKDTDEDKSGFLIMNKLIKLDQDNTLIQFSLRFVYFSMHYILSRLFSAPLPQPNCLVCHSGRPVTGVLSGCPMEACWYQEKQISRYEGRQAENKIINNNHCNSFLPLSKLF